MPKVLGYTTSYMGDRIYPFNALFDESRCVDGGLTTDIDALIVWGGEDIHPSLYGQKAHYFNQSQGSHPTVRDLREVSAIRDAQSKGIPIIGVCRGAQLLCALAGGSLAQHVNNHNQEHKITVRDGFEGNTLEMETSSAHHQMMNPWNLPKEDYDLLGWSSRRLSTVYFAEVSGIPEMNDYPEPEIIYFRKLHALAIQGHPEWMPENSMFNKYCLHLVNEFLFQGVEA